MNTVALDIEVYSNYFLVMLKDASKTAYFEMYPGKELEAPRLRSLLSKLRVVSFNGNHYDMPLLNAALNGESCAKIKAYSDQIILNDKKYWQLNLEAPDVDHIDLIEVAPGLTGLKTYAGRMGARKMQDLPIAPDASISPSQRAQLREYCVNDLDNTLLLFDSLRPQISLRERLSEQYGQDLRSKSDAQIAEAVIKAEVERLTQDKVGKPTTQLGRTFKYKAPAFLARTETVAFVESCEFMVAESGQPKCAALERHVVNGYRMGVGGLHSTESEVSHVIDDDEFLIERDVASYYPSIILVCGLYPPMLGETFLDVYRDIYDRRLAAKASGDKVTADTLKISLNGTFGKLGSKYSCLYSPDLLIQVTLTGQLALLQLIGEVEQAGAKVVSANTDGIVIRGCKRVYADVQAAIASWENATGFVTEEAAYKALHSRDVNSYVAIKPDGQVKVKGAYATTTLSKSPANEICTIAAIEWLRNGTSVEKTIRACKDIRQFCTVRAVRGGAVHRGQEIGKVVRWYRSIAGEVITYKSNGNRVPKSEQATPVMQLPDELPDDIDYVWYVAESASILNDVGIFKLF